MLKTVVHSSYIMSYTRDTENKLICITSS